MSRHTVDFDLIVTDTKFERAMTRIREAAEQHAETLRLRAEQARDGNAELQQATNDLTASVAALVDLPHPDDKEQQ